jgi:glycosyltransferase involved in cell wall biosynthesis
MKIAIIHYWLVGMRGGEKVLEAFCKLFPEADIFTHVYVPEAVSPTIRRHKIITTFINRLPRASRLYKKYLVAMPMALEQLDLSGYDLVISSEAGPAKGVIAPPGAVHICYCHSPMRYLWNMFHGYRRRSGPLTSMLMPPLAHYLRIWDVASSARVDYFIANSNTVAKRIRRYYRRESTVIHPPVDVDSFECVRPDELGDYYLMAGELVAYKRPELAVKAFNRIQKKLIVIGGGEMLNEIRRLAGPTVTVMGFQPLYVLRHHYARCRALIFPGEEDFGIVPVEAMASGRPVIAFGRGGATETVVPGLSGWLFEEQSVDAIVEAERAAWNFGCDSERIVEHASKFSSYRFMAEMTAYIEECVTAEGLISSALRPGGAVPTMQTEVARAPPPAQLPDQELREPASRLVTREAISDP